MGVKMSGNHVRSLIARHFLKKPVNISVGRFLGSKFSPTAGTRILIYHYQNDISWSLIYPYFYYAAQFERDHGVAVRTESIDKLLSGGAGIEADIVIFQPWFSEKSERISAAVSRYKHDFPNAKLVFLDGAAHTDLRHGEAVSDKIDIYMRKAIFCDRQQFLKSYSGDTNLTEYYGELYGIEAQKVNRHVPPRLLERLAFAPNFLTAPYLMDGFLGKRPDFSCRPIDLHSRIATNGTEWYKSMRLHADEAAKAIKGIRLTESGRIQKSKFLQEMRASKLCWSPFGYGELCWRDLEAFMTGAVLVKPDMGHLETRPNLYRAHETYLPVKWDFSDLEDVVCNALSRPDEMHSIANAAFSACSNYLTSNQFVRDTAQDFGLSSR